MKDNKINTGILIIVVLIICWIIRTYYFNKDNFEIVSDYEIDQDYYYRNYKTIPNDSRVANNQTLTKLDLENLVSSIVTYSNGAPKGANINVDQNKYDLIFTDIIVSSEKRKLEQYPNPNNYRITINETINKIYKAEIIEVYIPAATDDSINIPSNANRLYFKYLNSGVTASGYIVIQAGTYMNPETIACELSRQFSIVLPLAGITLSKTAGIVVNYDKNLNRYIIRDKNYSASPLPTLTIYTTNGYDYSGASDYVKNSITDLLHIFSDTGYIEAGPQYVSTTPDGNLYVTPAQPGDFGQYSPGLDVPLNMDSAFSNCILSGVVLTDCKLYLSLGKLNGNTCNIIQDENESNVNVPPIFCQIPNNACVSSSATKTLLNQPANFSAIQFYNPPLSKLNKLHVQWYQENGEVVRILDHCFTIRLYYFQKRFDTTDFSFPIP
jgi:hypothetical protein